MKTEGTDTESYLWSCCFSVGFLKLPRESASGFIPYLK